VSSDEDQISVPSRRRSKTDAEVDVAAAEAAMGTTWTHKGVDRQGRPETEAEVDAEVQAMMRTGV